MTREDTRDILEGLKQRPISGNEDGFQEFIKRFGLTNENEAMFFLKRLILRGWVEVDSDDLQAINQIAISRAGRLWLDPPPEGRRMPEPKHDPATINPLHMQGKWKPVRGRSLAGAAVRAREETFVTAPPRPRDRFEHKPARRESPIATKPVNARSGAYDGPRPQLSAGSYRLLALLASHGELKSGQGTGQGVLYQLAEHFGVTGQSIKLYLGPLTEHGLVICHRLGRRVEHITITEVGLERYRADGRFVPAEVPTEPKPDPVVIQFEPDLTASVEPEKFDLSLLPRPKSGLPEPWIDLLICLYAVDVAGPSKEEAYRKLARLAGAQVPITKSRVRSAQSQGLIRMGPFALVDGKRSYPIALTDRGRSVVQDGLSC